jgi:diguanylate cyclase (GGDEF)-like protein/PAS domain S-box-containing protein/putative nucleotidyltransferase with HDIG domain
MFVLRSAQGRAALASAVLLLALVAVAIVTVFRVRQHQEQLLALEDTAASVAALESARAELYNQMAAVSPLVFSDDPELVANYREAVAQMEQDLSQARAVAVTMDKSDYVATLDDLTERVGNFNQTVDVAIPILLQSEPESRVQLGGAAVSGMWVEVSAILDALDQLAADEQAELAAERAAANDAAAVTSWIIVGFGGIVLLMASGMVIATIASVITPLVSLRATARAITSGNLQSKARVSGPEEVASVARAFNEMTGALAAKTQEYIDTANLTGDMIVRLDKVGRFTFVNDGACQFFGKSREALLGNDAREFMHPEDLERAAQAIREVMKNKGIVRGFESLLVTSTGTKVLEWNGCPLFDEEDQYAGLQITGRDITERKQMEEALREGEEQYRAIFEQAADSIVLIDAETGALARFNDAAHQALGYTRAEFEKLKVSDFEITESPEELAEHIRQVINEGAATCEMKHRTKSGEIRDIEATCRAITIRGKDFIQAIFHDITERKKAEEALRESEERYRLITENVSDVIWTTDLDRRYTYVSPSVTAMRGYTPEELIGTKQGDVAPAASNEIGDKFFAEDLAGLSKRENRPLRPRTFEVELGCKDGSTIWAEIKVIFIRDSDGRPIGLQGVTRDITERKKAEEALRQSEERYRLITENVSDIIWTADLDRTYTYISPSVTAIRGYTPEELIGTKQGDLIPAVYNGMFEKALTEDMAGLSKRANRPLRPRTFEVELGCKDGSTIWAEVKVIFIRDSDGRPIGLQGVTRDITERKRMEQALRESEERYRLLTENTSDLIWTMDLGLRYTYMSPAIKRMRGYTPEEIMDAPITETMTPASVEVARNALAEQLAVERTGNADPDRTTKVELEMYCKDGSTIWTEMNMVWLRDPDGKPVGILGVTRDISERKRMEEALRKSEARYRLLAENTSDLIWTMDLDLRYTYMSPAIKHMRGYNVEEIVGTTVAETMTPASVEVVRKTLAEELAVEEAGRSDPRRSRTLELEMYCKDGSTIWTEINATFLRDSDGKVVGILGTTRDISERKRAEEERERLHSELELRAITDSLTGLYDHAHFYQRLAEEIDRSKRYKHSFALLLMDVDNFKRFNESRGHQVGDEMLRLVADCIRSGLRRSDIAFRYGGDEFAAILPHADPSKAESAVDRMNRRIAKRLRQMDGDGATLLTLTAGVACFPDDGATADELVTIADATLYNAKWVARARDIMGQREDIQSLVSALVSRQGGAEGSAGGAAFRPEALHEQQARIVSSVASSIAVALKDAGVAQALEDPDLQVLATVGAAAEIKDRYIRGHPERMSEQGVVLAEEMGLSPERVTDIRIAALLHDIGKVTVSEGILNKPGKLTKREFDNIKDHPVVGAALVSQVKGFDRLAKIVRHHHERFDGTGYPDGLVGEDIPPESRILSVLDVFDALTHERSYRKAESKEGAMAVIERGAGTQFDPVVVKAFLAMVRRGGDGLRSPAEAASEDKPLATVRAAARRKR